jgi:hypothetical protein
MTIAERKAARCAALHPCASLRARLIDKDRGQQRMRGQPSKYGEVCVSVCLVRLVSWGHGIGEAAPICHALKIMHEVRLGLLVVINSVVLT